MLAIESGGLRGSAMVTSKPTRHGGSSPVVKLDEKASEVTQKYQTMQVSPEIEAKKAKRY
jgi:hypothetical protein